jgi:hypothetical protein
MDSPPEEPADTGNANSIQHRPDRYDQQEDENPDGYGDLTRHVTTLSMGPRFSLQISQG